MRLWDIPWLELAILTTVGGAAAVSGLRRPIRSYAVGLAFTSFMLGCAVLAAAGYWLGESPRWSWQPALLGERFFTLDAFNAPLIPLLALIHFLTALATGRTKMRRFSSSWSLLTAGLGLALFSCQNPAVLTGLLITATLPPYVELRNCRVPVRVYVVHMGLFGGLLVAAQGLAVVLPAAAKEWAVLPLVLAVWIRCGMVPAHLWLIDWFERASFGIALLFGVPLSGVYAAVRLVWPVASDGMLAVMGIAALLTAVYAAGMAVVVQQTRQFYATLLVGHAALVLVGLALQTIVSLTGSLFMWFSVTMALGGLGLTLRALEARFGPLSLSRYHGLYEHSPMLAVCFLLTGLASVGFPGTLGFIAAEMLVEGAIESHAWVGIGVVLAAMLHGIAVMRAYFRLFTGARHPSSIHLAASRRERAAILTLAVLILGGGLFPQPGVRSRHQAATELLQQRERTREASPQGWGMEPSLRQGNETGWHNN